MVVLTILIFKKNKNKKYIDHLTSTTENYLYKEIIENNKFIGNLYATTEQILITPTNSRKNFPFSELRACTIWA